MESTSKDRIRKVTSDLRDEILRERLAIDKEPVFISVPHKASAPGQPVWRIRLDLSHDPSIRMGMDVNGEVVLGRDDAIPGSVALFKDKGMDIELLGVSRRHAMLRPTDGKLYLVDLGSTNGTWLNGTQLGANVPYSLSTGDYLKFGRLEFNLTILSRPVGHASVRPQSDLADILPVVAELILSQRDPEDVINKSIEMIKWHTPAEHVEFWLIDEQGGDLWPATSRHATGSEKGNASTLPINLALAHRVIESGKPVTVNRSDDGEMVKVKTGFLVEGMIYVPLALGGVTFGVLAAVHREPGKSFSKADEKLLTAVANFAALATQNARAMQSTNHALARRNKVISALNSALTYNLKSMLKSEVGFTSLLRSAESFHAESAETAEIIDSLAAAGDGMTALVDRMILVTRLSERSRMQQEACDMIEIAQQTTEDLHKAIHQKSVEIDIQVSGDPYLIVGDRGVLYRSVVNLIDNAIRFTAPETTVTMSLAFGVNDIVMRIRDMGPGIPEEDLPSIFEKYYRGMADSMGGSGLGLEIVQAAIENHRGTVSVHNVEDGGAEFVITLPASLRID